MSLLAPTLTDAATALRAGETTSVALTQRSIALADALDSKLGVYLTRFDEHALAAAVRADEELARGVDRGPLHGMPVGVKDIIAAAEGPTTANSLVLDRAWGADRDATAVERLREAGAVITGKLTTMEFAAGMPDASKPFPLPRNPWDTETWPGGSSSGSGAGVAAGFFPVAIGTDTAGSIRVPAAFCGTTGLMPTYGRVPASGCLPLGFSLDHIGPLARSARDCGAALGTFAGSDPRDPFSADESVPDFLGRLSERIDGLRIAVDRENHFGELDDPAARPVFEAALERLASLGASITEITLPHYDVTMAANMVTMLSEAFAQHRESLRERWDDYFAGTRQFIGVGALFSGPDYVQAQRVRRATQRALAAVFARFDVVAMPLATTGAPTYDQIDATGVAGLFATVYTPYWDAVGNPVLVVPMGFTGAGLPLSLQLAAAPFEEATLVQVGDAYQQVTDWHLRVPPAVEEVLTA
jgi:Asp-tRNA(Asn)/Glu-tRNA(Gln) amidotransferase A subunit family amidase